MRGIFESLIVFAVMAGVLLPARILFVEFVSDNWLGSFGVITAVSMLVIILAKKRKLGFFGPMLERQMYKFQKDKRGLVIVGESIFLLSILGVMIFAIEQGNALYAKLQYDSTNSADQVLESVSELETSDWLFGFLMAPVGFLTAPEMSMAIASIDQKLDGWLLHFYTVGFVEYLELLGILIYYKISFRLKPVSIASVYTKAAA